MAKITLAKTAGFCFGVDRAIKLIEKLLSEGKRVATLGPIIHNPQVIEDFKNRGVYIVEHPSEVEKNTVLVLRTHGVTEEVLEEVKKSGVEFIDAACPFVNKIHKIVRDNSGENVVTLIVGDPNHPEVHGIKSCAKGESYVVKDSTELEEILQKNSLFSQKEIILVAQTTFSVKEWQKSLKKVNLLCTNAKIFDTICSATEERQKEAVTLSLRNDAMVIVGGKHSSNTQKLKSVCEKNCPSFLVETKDELYGISFSGFDSIGLTAGASTPAGIIKEVLQTMSEIVNENKMIEEEKVQNSVSADDFDFAQALEESLNNLNSNQKVKGTVISVKSTEIQVDIGRKETGYIPYSEYSNDPNANPQTELKPGDQLDLIIMKTNNAEGVIMLSKKRYDAVKAWDNILASEGTDKVFEGVVTDVIRGGILVLSENVKVFIPASLATMNRNEKLEDLLKTTVQFKIIEINKQRKRAVGSIKAVLKGAKKEAEDKFWAEVKEGETVTGTVKSLTNYGAFVDIGGVDGMIHISELSWSRIKHPSEVVNVGDQVEVTIKALDTEKRKISLGFKKVEDNPWEILRRDYPVDSVADVKIVSFTSFGAFAQIIPGVDGLIHISQIANKHIANPADVLKVGEVVKAKITEIDFDLKRVGLSIRALLPEEPAEEAVEAVEEVADVAEETTETTEE
ncbi:MAG: bifunctional 4-hydroxy-3-methylbut-2-enyl diphosphate reductase/30S ribosomal protein S1 [Clostridia bacterium]|nr:bifunctional 4-hydroxy-3-methylbut-2-enyl diphosphate reductase/30S ribosomal protein S1 [Clostridia bacterium]